MLLDPVEAAWRAGILAWVECVQRWSQATGKSK